MNVMECVKISLASIVSNKLRTLLTIIGITIGISSVIAIISIGKGGQTAILNEFDKLGTNSINIRAKTGVVQGKDILRLDDAVNIEKYIPQAESVTPVFNGFGLIKNNNKIREAYIWGIDKDFKDIFSLELLHGRLINQNDTRLARNVVVIDNVVAKKLFHRGNVIGKTINLIVRKDSVILTIIGVVKNSNEIFDNIFDEQVPTFIYMPITTLQRIYNSNYVDFISVKVGKGENPDEVGIKIVNFLERSHHTSQKYYAENMLKQREQVRRVTNILTYIIGAIGAISLIVGGIGIMNIMLVSVKERTKEIGIRKAVGARKGDILKQFLTEAVLLTLIGGIMGIATGIFFSWLLSVFSGLPMEISMPTIIIALLFSAFIGILFGVYPAQKASNLDPIEALRYE